MGVVRPALLNALNLSLLLDRLLRFVQVFLQVGHEGGAARSYGGGVAREGLMLAVNVTVGISDVNLAKLREQIDTGAIGCPEFGTAEFSIADKS